jgi:thymidylate kinase
MWEFFLRPDATVLFVSDPVKAIHRIGTRGPRTSYERMEFLAQVQEAFIALEAKEPDRFMRVYADIPLENLIKEVEAKVKKVITR